ncbi:MAG TPA: winged helix-turn-helix domain-containing protein [Acidobacteriaceae bacterium]|nr:winged helix-turn-helix domain-containing protein [Acidobacteriaceae bacterium]
MVRFGPYEVRPSTRELFRHGLRIKLPPQAFEVLRVLLERPGELVTRQEFHRILWAADTFVDFDQGLNNAIKRIREVLNDSADAPRYIETLPRLGYRFIGTVERAEAEMASPAGQNGHAPAPASALSAKPALAPELEVEAPAPASRRKSLPGLMLVAAAALALLPVTWLFRPSYPEPRITGEAQLTADGIPKWGPLVTDGLRVYFTERLNGKETIAAVPISGGQAVPLRTPFDQAGLYAISPNRNDLLIAETHDMHRDAPLWRLPIIGGTPRRLGTLAAHDASWSPDGTRLACTIGSAVYIANADGSDPRILVPSTGVQNELAWHPTWSPDSRRLRFDYFEMQRTEAKIWEVNVDGTNLHPLFASPQDWPMQAYGTWTADGRFYIFSAWKEKESSTPTAAANLWAVREKVGLVHRTSPSPNSLTAGPIRYFFHTPSLDGETIFALSSLKHGELMRYDPHSKRLSLYASDFSAEGVSFSPDGAWMVWVKFPQGELWRSRTDGSEPLQLSSRPLFVTSPVWSPDGRQIAFAGMRAGETWRSYTVSADGGDPRPIGAIGEAQDPAWSPDGNSLVYVDTSHGDDNTLIQIRNLRSGDVTSIPGSRGFWSPRMSPDGRWIAALSNNIRKLLLFDSHTRTWKEVATADGIIVWPQWSRDSTYLYFSYGDPEPHIFRINVNGGKPEAILTLKDFRTTGVLPGWFSVAPNGDILLLHDAGGGTEIYALSWDAP